MTAFLAVVALALALSGGAEALPYTTKYDREIKRAVERQWPDYPVWRQWKAQLISESNLDPRAVSPVGARGMAQFMPRTWVEVTRAMQLGAASPHDVSAAIEAGAYYMRQMRALWRGAVDERMRWGQASYNAGGGNIKRAWRLCDEPATWAETVPCLPDITGHHSAETIGYVKRIWRIWRELEAGG